MNITYRKGTMGDIDLLVKTRIEVLRAANKLNEHTDMTAVEQETRLYYNRALRDNSHTAYLVFDGDTFIGAGGVSYYTVMPTYHNPTGKKAYIMNMYVRPGYRRAGIATKTLSLLVKDAGDKGTGMITLEATSMGKPLYEKFGFVPMQNEMELPDH